MVDVGYEMGWDLKKMRKKLVHSVVGCISVVTIAVVAVVAVAQVAAAVAEGYSAVATTRGTARVSK